MVLVSFCLPLKLSAQITETFTSDGTFTVPAGVTEITVQAWGGGGGGADRSNNFWGNRYAGGGGGGGGFVSGTLIVNAGDVITITVGEGGVGGSSNGQNGVLGENSVVSHTSGTITAEGGAGGTTSNNPEGGAGGGANFTGSVSNKVFYTGGTGANGTNENGGGGGGGAGSTANGSNGSGTTGGIGGSANGGNGGSGSINDNQGDTGNNYGGGGGGSSDNNNSTGGSGADGLVKISYIPPYPYFSVSPSYIDFGYVASASTDVQTITLNGYNLDGTNVTITGSFDFQVSTDNVNFSNVEIISGYGSSFSQDIYVQFGPTGLPTDYNDIIDISGGGITLSESVNVTGTSNVTYCEPSVANNMRYIDRVRLGTIDNTPTGTGFTTGGYADYTGLSTDLDVGEQNVSITIDVYSNTAYGIHVWIDWDQDGEFTQIGDNIICDYGLNNNGNNQETYTFDVPSDATIGSTRMRVRLIYNNNSCDNPCLDFDYGEVEDYSLNILPPVSITTDPISPLSYCPGALVSVSYSITGTFNAGNVFTAQLSDENGSFASPVDIGSVTSQSSGTISATIPSSGIVDGNGYRIRVVSSDPVYTGTDNGSDISIGSPELITSPGSQCKYGTDVTVSVSASSSQSGIFRWYSDAAGTNLLQESTSSETSSEYTVTISSSQTFYVEIESGGCSSALTPVSAYAIIPPTLNATAGGTFCQGETVYLYSDGSGYDNLYWEGPNSFYSNNEDPVINNATTGMTGTYTVHTSTLSGVNLVTNGDFEDGNVGFTSEYDYEEDLPGVDNELVPEGAYSVTNMPGNVHYDFCDDCPDKTTGAGLQMVINGSTNSGDSIWMQKVNVVPNTSYQFSYFIQSVPGAEDQSPSELQFYVNGAFAGPVYTAEATTGLWTQFFYNWNSGSSTEAYLSLVNRNTVGGGNDFALDDIVFQHTCTAEASVDVTVGTGFTPDVTISADPGETICDGDLATFTATPINGGTNPTYQWYLNGVLQTGENSVTYASNSITDGDNVSCEMTSNLACISGSATVTSSVITMNVVPLPTASAGANLTSCGTAVVITNDATASEYNNIGWTTSGSGVFSDASSLTACTYTPSAADITAGSVTLTLTAYGNTPCGNAVSTKTMTFVDPVDVSVATNNTNYCPQFLPPVSFNNDDDPRPPGYTEVGFTVTRNNTSAAWTIFTDFTVTATPSLSGLSVENVVVTDEGDNPITVTGTNQYNINASNNFVTIRAQVLNQPGHSLEVGLNVYDVEDANGCIETVTTNNDAVVDIYPMPAIGRFE